MTSLRRWNRTVETKELEGLGTVREVEKQENRWELDKTYVRELDRRPDTVKEPSNLESA